MEIDGAEGTQSAQTSEDYEIPPKRPSQGEIETSQYIAYVADVSGEATGNLRDRISYILKHFWSEVFIALVILFNFVLICLDTDSRAIAAGASSGSGPDQEVGVMMDVCFVIFLAELCLRVFVDRGNFLTSYWNRLDLFIVVLGIVEFIVSLSGQETNSFGILRIIRLCRLLRLLRVMRFFSILKELRRFLQLMDSCFKTLIWSFAILAFLMTCWAIIAVEIINPIVQDLADRGEWLDCLRCRRAFSSVFLSNMTFFQTVVAGDSWGLVALPVIEASPWSAAVFVGAMLTLAFGVLNLIVVVMVDCFAERRSKDVFARADEMDFQEVQEKKALAKIFAQLDKDDSGLISIDELEQGARRVAEFRHWLRVLDIDARDLRQLFFIIDEDESGEVDIQEFINTMYRMKNTESRTATRFVKQMITKMKQENHAFQTLIEGHFETLRQSMDKVGDVLHKGNAEDVVQGELQCQEAVIQRALETALERASEVAIEAALRAAVSAIPSTPLMPDFGFLHPEKRVDPGSRARLSPASPTSPNLRHLAKPPVVPRDPELFNYTGTSDHTALAMWEFEFEAINDECGGYNGDKPSPSAEAASGAGPVHPVADSG